MKIAQYIEMIESAKKAKEYLMLAVDEPDDRGFISIPQETGTDILDVIDNFIGIIRNLEVHE